MYVSQKYKYKGTRYEGTMLMFNVNKDPRTTFEIVTSTGVDVIDADQNSGLVILNTNQNTDFNNQIIIKQNNDIIHTFNIISGNIVTEAGFEMSDDDTFGGNP